MAWIVTACLFPIALAGERAASPVDHRANSAEKPNAQDNYPIAMPGITEAL